MGSSIQKWTNQICGGQPLKNLTAFKCFKGSLPQSLLGSFLNTLSHMLLSTPLSLIFSTIHIAFTNIFRGNSAELEHKQTGRPINATGVFSFRESRVISIQSTPSYKA